MKITTIRLFLGFISRTFFLHFKLEILVFRGKLLSADNRHARWSYGYWMPEWLSTANVNGSAKTQSHAHSHRHSTKHTNTLTRSVAGGTFCCVVLGEIFCVRSFVGFLTLVHCVCVFELVKLFCWQSRHGSSLVCSVSLYLSWHWMTAAMTNVATKIFNGDKNRVKRKKRHKIFKKKKTKLTRLTFLKNWDPH